MLRRQGWKDGRKDDVSKSATTYDHNNPQQNARNVGQDAALQMMVLLSSLLSSSSFRIASCRWRGVMRRFLLSCATVPASSQTSATRSERAPETAERAKVIRAMIEGRDGRWPLRMRRIGQTENPRIAAR